MVSWSKGHFEKVAHVIDETIEDQDIKNTVCKRFAYDFSYENPRFDRNKFLDACGVEEEAKILIDENKDNI